MTKELLSAKEIAATIQSPYKSLLSKLEIFDIIDSTNTYLLTHANVGPSGWACFAEQQTHGRGRLGRKWVSPHGTNIYCSLLWRFPKEQDLSGLSLAVAVMILQALHNYGITAGIQLKWPNDILFANRKLAGILLERKGNAVIVGVGINLILPDNADPQWLAIANLTPQPIKRNFFAGLVINELLAGCLLYEKQGLPAFLSQWRQHDFLIGKNITIHQAEKSLRGVMHGINQRGELLMQNADEPLQSFHVGEVSVRAD